jgi:uracil-DNA glycosylase
MTSYDQIVCDRKSCRKCADLVNPADPVHAKDDDVEVGPWSRWFASRPAKLVVVGQDWGTVGYFQDHGGRDVDDNLTNRRLTEFLSLLGFRVGPANQTDRQSGVFATNAILCLKKGGAKDMSAPVKQAWFNACGSLLKRRIEETSAPTIIALGRRSYEAVARAYGATPQPFREAIEKGSPVQLLNGQRLLFAVFHPAARPKDRKLQEMRADWLRISHTLKALAA